MIEAPDVDKMCAAPVIAIETWLAEQVFNILCEQPETVAAFLVPRIRTVVARKEAQRYIRYLTVWSALTRFITAPLRAQRFFDADGETLLQPWIATRTCCCS